MGGGLDWLRHVAAAEERAAADTGSAVRGPPGATGRFLTHAVQDVDLVRCSVLLAVQVAAPREESERGGRERVRDMLFSIYVAVPRTPTVKYAASRVVKRRRAGEEGHATGIR